MNTSELETARAKVRAFAARVKTDKPYGRKAQEDPVATLREAGVSDEAIAEFLHVEGLIDDVSGFAFLASTKLHLGSVFDCNVTANCSFTGKCWVTD